MRKQKLNTIKMVYLHFGSQLIVLEIVEPLVLSRFDGISTLGLGFEQV